jgi:hypothetical protein
MSGRRLIRVVPPSVNRHWPSPSVHAGTTYSPDHQQVTATSTVRRCQSQGHFAYVRSTSYADTPSRQPLFSRLSLISQYAVNISACARPSLATPTLNCRHCWRHADTATVVRHYRQPAPPPEQYARHHHRFTAAVTPRRSVSVADTVLSHQHRRRCCHSRQHTARQSTVITWRRFGNSFTAASSASHAGLATPLSLPPNSCRLPR